MTLINNNQMKSRFIFIVFILTWVNLQSQLIENLDRSSIAEKKIKIQKTFEYEVNKGKRATKGIPTKELHFDLKGNLERQVNLKRNGSVHSILLYKYDDNGNKVLYEKYIGSDSLNYKQNVKFDSKGKRAYEKGFDGVDSFRIVYNYNKSNKLVESIYYSGKKIDEKRVFTYDANIATIKVLDGSGALLYTLQNRYNDANKILEEKRIEKDNTITKRSVYDFDKQNNPISESKYIGNNLINKITYLYNPKGLLIEVLEENNTGEKYLIKKYQYNEKNQLIEEQYRSGPDKEFSINTFKYNDRGVCEWVETYFATYKYQTHSAFIYDYFE